MNKTDVASTFRLFGELLDSVQARVLETCSTRTYKEGQQIFCQGDAPEAFYIVMTGRVKMVRVTPKGYENILCMRGPRDHFCPVPTVDYGSQLGQAIAMAPTTVLWIDRGSFMDLCDESVELLSIIQGNCLNEVRNLLERLEIIAFTRFTSPPTVATIVLIIVHTISGLTIFALPIVAVSRENAPGGFIFVTVGGTLIGLGGIALAFLKTGGQLLFFSSDFVFTILAPLLLLMTLSFTWGFTKQIRAA